MFEAINKTNDNKEAKSSFFGNTPSLSFFGPGIQRQTPTTKPVTPTPPVKNLNQQNISAGDHAFSGAAQIIDDVFARNKRFAKYLAGSIGTGKSIADKGKFIIHPTKQTYQDAQKAYDKTRTGGSGGDAAAFYWESETVGKVTTIKQEIHLSPDANFGTAFHEAVHKMSDDVTVQLRDDPSFAFDVNEGLTSWFSKEILKDEGVDDYIDGYPFQREKAGKFIKALGIDAIGYWYFAGNSTELKNKLGMKKGDKDFIKKLKAYWP